jgi:2,4-dienoyl-CoA reductase-like NADH-dependent reductase (Old Yellow Enzyme family)
VSESTAGDPLLEPFQLRHLTLRNRVMSTAHEPAYSDDGMPGERYVRYHVEKAKGGLALTMTAGSALVAEDSPPAFGNLHAYDDAIVPHIRRLVDAVHEHGCAVMIQLTHLGRRTAWNTGDWLPVVAPSRVREPAHRSFPKEAEDWDLDRIVSRYADAAERMIAGGMDGIELEAYGHLLDSFWSPVTNRRTDEYGGSLENRARFPERVLGAIRERTRPDAIVGIRMVVDENQAGGLSREDGFTLARRLADARLVDFVNVIRGHIESDASLSEVIPIQGMRSAPHLDISGDVRAAIGLPVFHAARIDDVATARHAVREGLVDMVGMTRAHLADPHIVRKIRLGREAQIRPCVGATYCLDRIYEGGEALCIHNAATGREMTMPHEIPKADLRRRVLVVGAGPAGLEAARVAGERGHDVTVLEAMPWAGGQLRLAVRNPRRRDLIGIVGWRLAELERLGVDVRYDTFADEETVRGEGADVVVVATGGQAQLVPLEEGESLVTSSWDVLGGDARPSGRVLLFDDNGAHPGMTTAELLACSPDVSLELVTPERFFAPEVGGLNHVPYARALHQSGSRITINTRLVAVRREGDALVAVLGSDYSPRREERHVDHVVVEYGTCPSDELYLALKERTWNRGEVDHAALIAGRPQEVRTNPSGEFQLFRIGDAVSSRNIHAAVYDALRLVKDL